MSIVGDRLSCTLRLHRLMGHYPAGMAALEAYLTAAGEVTADYVAARIEGLKSEDTTRRWLHDMERMGIVTSRKSGRTIFYRLKPTIAEAALAILEEENC